MALKTKISIIIILMLGAYTVTAQTSNWQNLDLKTDSVFGISTEKAYEELLKGKKANTVIVAVIDAGVDSAHEDLKSVIWNNPKRNKNNDLHGWNFIGSSSGDVLFDNLELTRQVRQQQAKFEGKDSAVFFGSERVAFRLYQKERHDLDSTLKQDQKILKNIDLFKLVTDTIASQIGKDDPALTDFENFQPKTSLQEWARNIVVSGLRQEPDYKTFKAEDIEKEYVHYYNDVNYHLNISYDSRSIVADDYFNSNQRNYGNNNITGPDATHGTHVAGIIAGERNNNLGINGVADHVLIMSLRVVPDGDERDKDVANAIRYATDHGAKVINMSFGKAYSQDKNTVDDAVKYAMAKDVLIIHAAGNDNRNLDVTSNFPNRNYSQGGYASAWIEVGACGWKNDSTLKAPFSNYGKHSVDVFAPGEQIYSTLPNNKYAALSGTSMAAPVVSGLAALVREYYPRLTAIQVKEIIMRSVSKVDHEVKLSSPTGTRNLSFSDLCQTGGIINAYKALRLAGKYKYTE